MANGGSNAVPNAVAPRAAAGYQQVQANGPALAGWCNRARRERRPHATCAPHGALILLRRDRRPALNSTRGCPRSGRPPTSSGERPSVSWPVEPCPTRTTSPCDLRATWRLDIASPRPLSRIEFDPRVCCQRVHHVAHATRSPGWPLTRADGGSNAAPNAVAPRAAAGYQQVQANGPASAGRCNRARRERRPHATCVPHGASILLRRDRRPALNSTRGCAANASPCGSRHTFAWFSLRSQLARNIFPPNLTLGCRVYSFEPTHSYKPIGWRNIDPANGQRH